MNRATHPRPLLLSSLLVLAACSHGDPSARPAASASAPVPLASASAPPDAGGPLLHPERATEQAPAKFKVKFTTTRGDFVVEVTRAWAPVGADRFYNLVKLGYYDGNRFYRAVDKFMVQVGLSADPAVSEAWARAPIADDPVVKSNTRGFVTFAAAGPGSRTAQIFISYVDQNKRLDAMGFAPFGQVVDGMKVVDSLYKGYGETAPRGKGPDASRLQSEGEAYLAKEFPELDRIKEARLQ